MSNTYESIVDDLIQVYDEADDYIEWNDIDDIVAKARKLKAQKKEEGKNFLEAVIKGAEQHGLDSGDLEHEAGDLQQALSLAFEFLSADQQKEVSQGVAECSMPIQQLLDEMEGEEG